MNTPVVIRLLRPANGGSTPLDGLYLVEYDPTRPGRTPSGRPLSAHIKCSANPAQAKQFPDAAEALAYYRATSGKPHPQDRPLTYWSIVVEPAP